MLIDVSKELQELFDSIVNIPDGQTKRKVLSKFYKVASAITKKNNKLRKILQELETL